MNGKTPDPPSDPIIVVLIVPKDMLLCASGMRGSGLGGPPLRVPTTG